MYFQTENFQNQKKNMHPLQELLMTAALWKVLYEFMNCQLYAPVHTHLHIN